MECLHERQYFNSQTQKGNIRNASAIWTPAIADGLSSRTSASLQPVQESKSTVVVTVRRIKLKKYDTTQTLVKPWSELVVVLIDCKVKKSQNPYIR